MIYVVLGMHKSGTTLVSQILHHSGISMGEIAEGVSYDHGNKYEDQESLAINLELIRAPDYEILYIPPPEPLEVTEEQRARMRRFVAARSARHADWGFKDPRTTLVYPLWERELPEHRIIAVWRSPEEIWPRFRAPGLKFLHQEPKRAWNYVIRWCEHNERIVRTLEGTSRDWLLINYREFMTGERDFRRLQDFVGRPLDDRRRKGLYRNEPRKYIVLSAAQALVRWRKGNDPAALTRQLERLSGEGGSS